MRFSPSGIEDLSRTLFLPEHAHTHTHTHTHTNTHTVSLALFHTHTRTHTHCASLFFPFLNCSSPLPSLICWASVGNPAAPVEARTEQNNNLQENTHTHTHTHTHSLQILSGSRGVSETVGKQCVFPKED